MLKQWSIFLLEYGIFQEIFRKLFQAIFLLTEIYPLIVPRRFFFRGIYILNYVRNRIIIEENRFANYVRNVYYIFKP